MKLTIKYVMQSKNENEVILGMPKKQQLFSWEEEENLHSRSCSVFSHGLDGFKMGAILCSGKQKGKSPQGEAVQGPEH